MNMSMRMSGPESGMEKKKTFREVAEPIVSRMSQFNTPYIGQDNEELSIIDFIEAGKVNEVLMFETDTSISNAIVLLASLYEELKKDNPDQVAIEKITKKLEALN